MSAYLKIVDGPSIRSEDVFGLCDLFGAVVDGAYALWVFVLVLDWHEVLEVLGVMDFAGFELEETGDHCSKYYGSN